MPILIIAANKKARTETIIIFIHPKNSPSAPINLTSPNPIASLPAINPPSSVINRKIPLPTSIPKILLVKAVIPKLVFKTTFKKVNTSQYFFNIFVTWTSTSLFCLNIFLLIAFLFLFLGVCCASAADG